MKRPIGLTNKIILNNNILTKVSTPIVDYFINRTSEDKLYDQLKDQDLDFILKPIKWGFDNKNNFYSEWTYYPKAYTFKDEPLLLRQKDIWIKITDIIEKYHNIKVDMPKFNPQEYLNKFKTKIKRPLVDLSNYNKMLDMVISNYYDDDTKLVLSHNDMVPGNFLIFENGDIKLIDFEYTVTNHYLFDYASFITESLPQDKEEEFIKFLNLEKSEIIKLRYIIFYQYILWIHWANYMYEQYAEPIYMEIVNEKYERLINDIKLKDLEI